MEKSKQGHVYILESDNCDCIKIGGTDFPPAKRLREINDTEPYKSLGPWRIVDFREVSDWRKVEHNLHYQFRDVQNHEIKNQKELFHLNKKVAVDALCAINPDEVLYRPKIDRLFQEERFLKYITELFKATGILNCIDMQGIWTFALFPSTNGGRFFTLNIGSHEVAFSTVSKKDRKQENYIVVDKMIFDPDFTELQNWILSHNGGIQEATYSTAKERAAAIHFECEFSEAIEIFKIQGFRRAVIAYWYDTLIDKANENKFSTYERYHNYNAVARILEYSREKDT